MERVELKAVFQNLVRAVATRLSVHGFEHRRLVLQKSVGSNVALIEFQLSDKSSRERLVFTVNLGIICGEISRLAAFRKAGVTGAHLSERLGFLLPERADQWWEIEAHTDIIALGNELATLIEEHAVPYLAKYSDSRALIALWEAGESPGLTAVQRARFLSRLRNTT